MVWRRPNGRWAALNLFAVSVMAVVLGRGSLDGTTTQTFDPMLLSGKWAIRFLLFCLAMTPLNTYFGWRSVIKLRKPAGLWAFGFAALHVLFYLTDAQLTGLSSPMLPYFALGLLGLSILTALAITSNRWAMQRLGKSWKRLHRLVYLAGIAVVFHAILATTVSKKIAVRDPQAVQEFKLYLALLVALLMVRVTRVRSVLKRLPTALHQPHPAEPPAVAVTIPGRPPGHWPNVRWIEAGFSPDGLSSEIQSDEDAEREKVLVN